MHAKVGCALLGMLLTGACSTSGGGTGTTGGANNGTSGMTSSGSTGSASRASAGTNGTGSTTATSSGDPLGSECATASTCERELFCATEVPNGFCTKLCSANGDCPSGGLCTDVPSVAEVCAQSCTVQGGCARANFSCDPVCGVCVPTMAVGQVTCTGSHPGHGGHTPDGGACGTEPSGVTATPALTWSASLEVSGAGGSGSENEAAIAVMRSQVLVAFMADGGQNSSPDWIGFSSSSNDGNSFQLGTAEHGMGDPLVFDPSLAFDSSGTAYLAYAGYAGPGATGHLWLATAAAGGAFGTPVSALSPQSDIPIGGNIDKPFLAVDPDTNAPVVVYSAFAVQFGQQGSYNIQLSAGAVGGSDFGPAIVVNDLSRAAFRDLPSLAFDVRGNAYVAWIETTDSASVVDDQTMGTRLLGNLDTRVNFALLAGANGSFTAPTGNAPVVSAASDNVVVDGPKLAVSADGSTIFVAYVVGNNDATDIAVASSSDHGVTWSAPVIVNDDPGCATHFHPWPFLDGKGRLWLTWIDNRDGRGHVMYAVSTDGGHTFTPARLVSDVPLWFTTLLNVPGWLGGYQQLVGTSTQLFSVWTGAPNGTDDEAPAHVYVQSATLP